MERLSRKRGGLFLFRSCKLWVNTAVVSAAGKNDGYVGFFFLLIVAIRLTLRLKGQVM